ncbi:SLOG family protein [Brevundimonas sp. KM4]|uniref:SLOG family protein n=1 Tax=Brevundimonas sp. KM4 TaxID=1628191 RepID=UPI000698C72E
MSSTSTLSLFPPATDTPHAANVLAAARALAGHLARSRPLDRRLVSEVMTTLFGGADTESKWLWRDAYEAIEAATVLQIRRLAPQVARLEDAPAEIAALLAAVSALGLTHSRRSEDQVALDQFSTPPELAAIAVLAAQVRPGDRVLEPSAGTGLIAAVAEACGGVLWLNEPADGRAALLDGLFPAARRSRLDGRHIHDLLDAAGRFDVAVCNPPFTDLDRHLKAALGALADGGRLAAVAPASALSDEGGLRRLSDGGRIVARILFPPRAFARHGTSVETGLLVLERDETGAEVAPLAVADDLATAAILAAAVPGRAGARPRARLEASPASLLAPGGRAGARASARLAFLAGASAVDYETRAWTGEGRDIGLYQAHGLARIVLPDPRPHPSPLVESGPMASVAPPAPTYRPVLPRALRDEGRISDAQAIRSLRARTSGEADPGGPVIAFRGAPSADTAEDAGRIFDALNWALAEWPDMALATTGAKGSEKLAIKWSQQKGVKLILARADFDTHGKAAPFRANDDLIALEPTCCLTLAHSLGEGRGSGDRPFGPAMNLGQKAMEHGVRHVAIRARAA